MDYETVLADTWRHQDPSGARDYTRLVRYATLAASSHNTQPWRFRLEHRTISILPDLLRRCPAVDPDDHHLYASLGCAAENLLLAAEAAGLRGNLCYKPDSHLQVDLDDATPSRSTLFEAIPHRQCSRTDYAGSVLSGEELRLLEKVAQGKGVSVVLLTTSKEREQVAEYVAAGNTEQFADPQWAHELKAWTRFNAREALRTADGLYGPAMGKPEVPRWLGMLYMRLAFSAKTQNKKDIEHIRSSPAIAVVFSDIDDEPHWIEAGRCYERLALQATALGLATAFINQPVEVPRLRSQLASFLGIGDRRPDLVIRIGRGTRMPRSLRRPVADVLV